MQKIIVLRNMKKRTCSKRIRSDIIGENKKAVSSDHLKTRLTKNLTLIING